jgi:L-threonylcarbamoyladenylate synthase
MAEQEPSTLGGEGWHWGASLELPRAVLGRGGILAIPTESSYGLAVDPRDERGVEAVYRLKERQRGQPLPVVAANLEQLAELGIDVDERRFRSFAALWPAPLSLIVPATPGLPAAAGGDSLAVRLPRHRSLRRLLAELGTALTATSANRSGEPPVTDPSLLTDLLAGADALVIDDGILPGGPPSTMLSLVGGQVSLMRRGRYPMADLRRRAPDLEQG